MTRQLWDIYADMLATALKPTRKTKIMYQNNMSHTQLQIHLNTLVKQGYMKKTKNTYKTTNKGETWLKLYQSLKLLSPE